jgi:hypothetical protein
MVVIGNRFYELVTDRFNFCNRCLRSLLLEVLIGNGRCGGEFGVEPAALVGNRR